MFLGGSDRTGGSPYLGVAGVRRELLEQVKVAITSEPAALGGPTAAPDDRVGDIRGTVSVTIGNIVMRLNQAGFTESDRLYVIRDDLAAGKPIRTVDLLWLDGAIEHEDVNR